MGNVVIIVINIIGNHLYSRMKTSSHTSRAQGSMYRIGWSLAISIPMFSSTGEALADMIKTGLESIHCLAIFFPEVCSAPICLVWPTATTFEAFQQSSAVLDKPFLPFILLIQTLEPQLLPWFNAVNQDATHFSITACPWQDLAAAGFPHPNSAMGICFQDCTVSTSIVFGIGPLLFVRFTLSAFASLQVIFLLCPNSTIAPGFVMKGFSYSDPYVPTLQR
jgi:hypothetical protein